MPDAIANSITNTTPNSCVFAQCDRIGKPWKLSDDGISFMAVCESGVLNGTYMGMPVVDGMILKVYVDSKGYPTVGFGHKIVPSDHLRVGQTISIERARELSKKNKVECESAVNRRIMVPLHQYEYDALVSIAFNAGIGQGIAELVKRVNSGEYGTLPDYIRAYRSSGIEWRRSLEARLFATGNYDARHGRGIDVE